MSETEDGFANHARRIKALETKIDELELAITHCVAFILSYEDEDPKWSELTKARIRAGYPE